MKQSKSNNIGNMIKGDLSDKFSPLCAQPLDSTSEIYRDALDFAIDNNDIKNIAISGTYCSGKSTIWNTYVENRNKNRNRNRIIQVQLGSYAKNDLSPNNASNCQNTLNENRIEQQIINQIIAQVKISRIPLYDYGLQRRKSFYNYFINIVMLLLLFIGVIFFNSSDTTLRYTSIVSIGIFIFIACILFTRKDKFNLSRISIKGVEATFASHNNDETILDRENKQLVYLLERSKSKIVVFEDLDRFENIEIFNKLKELNFLLNSYIEINRRKYFNKILDKIYQITHLHCIKEGIKERIKEGNSPVKFLYMVKDSIFISEDRTKFFDFIIPVVPIINSYNSIDYFIDEINRSGIESKNFDKKLLITLSVYMNDMRILKNTINEFIVYKNNLNYDELELDDNKLLVLVFIKNISPKEYELLCAGQGFIYSILDETKDLIDNVKQYLDIDDEEFHDILNSKQIFELITLDTFKKLYNNKNLKSDLEEPFLGLIYFLIKKGFLDKTYYYYIGKFKIGAKGKLSTLGRNDRKFYKNLRQQEFNLVNLEIENPAEINLYLEDDDFQSKYIINSTLLRYLVEEYRNEDDEFAKRVVLMSSEMVDGEEGVKTSLILSSIDKLDNELLKKYVNLLIIKYEDLFIELLEYSVNKNDKAFKGILLIYLSLREKLIPTDRITRLVKKLDGSFHLLDEFGIESYDILLENIVRLNIRFNLFMDKTLNEALLGKMIDSSLFIKDINNIHFVVSYLLKRNIEIVDLIHELLSEPLLSTVFDKIIHENTDFFTDYINMIKENEKCNLQDGVLQDIIMSEFCNTDTKKKYIAHSDSKVQNLVDIEKILDFDSILPCLTRFGLVEFTEENLQILWDNNHVDKKMFIDYIEKNINNCNFDQILSNNAKICNALIVWRCSDSLFNFSLQIANEQINDVGDIDIKTEKNRIKKLINRKLIALNAVNVRYLIQQDYIDELYLLSKQGESELVNIMIKESMEINIDLVFYLANKISKENLINLINGLGQYISIGDIGNNDKEIKFILSLDEIPISFRTKILDRILARQIDGVTLYEYLKNIPEIKQLLVVFKGSRPKISTSDEMQIVESLSKYGYVFIIRNKSRTQLKKSYFLEKV